MHASSSSSPVEDDVSSFARVTAFDNDRPRTWRQRPSHRRRASQPVDNQLLHRHSRRSGNTSAIVSADEASGSALDDGSIGARASASGGSASRCSSDDEEEAYTKQRESLEYLDLSISVPYTLASLRDQLLAYTSQLEDRVKSLYPFHASAVDGVVAASSDSDSTNLPAVFYTHLDALKDELRAMFNALPLPSAAPLASSGRAGAALLARGQTLASSGMNSLSSLPQFEDVGLAALWAHLANALPTPQQSHILFSVQRRFDALQEVVRAMTLRELLFSASDANTDPATPTRPSRSRRQSFIESQQALTRQFEAILDSVKAKGEEVRLMGHARASSMVKAARDAEEHIYAKAVALARNGQMLIRYEHLPELWKNNEHILSGYRFIPKEEWTSLLKSTFEIHNETGNIMTHLVGALIVTLLFWPSKERFDEHTTPTDRMVQTIYLFAALKCLVLSVSWHVMAGCSDALLFERFACVDYTGIAWLVAASVWTLVYNAFYCQPNLAMIYSLSTLLVGLVGAIVPWAAWFNERRNKPIRIAVFLTMCFTGLAPFTHAVLSHGIHKTFGFFGAILPSLFAYVFGLIFYATQFPERFAPGSFDIVGHAHQIWHISIVVAILLHYRATFFWHENRFNFSCAASAMPATSPVSNLLHNRLAVDLNVADEVVHGWRIVAGRVGDGLVGRIWDRCIDALMSTF